MAKTTAQTVLDLVPEFLRAVSVLSPSVGPWLPPVLNTVAALVEAGDHGLADLAKLTAEIKAMADAGLAPTDDEWAAFQARSNAAHAAIQQVKLPPG